MSTIKNQIKKIATKALQKISPSEVEGVLLGTRYLKFESPNFNIKVDLGNSRIKVVEEGDLNSLMALDIPEKASYMEIKKSSDIVKIDFYG